MVCVKWYRGSTPYNDVLNLAYLTLASRYVHVAYVAVDIDASKPNEKLAAALQVTPKPLKP